MTDMDREGTLLLVDTTVFCPVDTTTISHIRSIWQGATTTNSTSGRGQDTLQEGCHYYNYLRRSSFSTL
jgi:hypothetical protein